jgi:hypothetical protein
MTLGDFPKDLVLPYARLAQIAHKIHVTEAVRQLHSFCCRVPPHLFLSLKVRRWLWATLAKAWPRFGALIAHKRTASSRLSTFTVMVSPSNASTTTPLKMSWATKASINRTGYPL